MTREDVRAAYELEAEIKEIYSDALLADDHDGTVDADRLKDAMFAAEEFKELYRLSDAELLADEIDYILGDECDDVLNSLLNCLEYVKDMRSEVQALYNGECEVDAPYTLRDFMLEERGGRTYAY